MTVTGDPDDPGASPDVEAAAEILGPLAQRDASLAPFCTYRVGGSAALLVEARSFEDLVLVRRAVAASGCPTLVVGKGSNLLVADAGFGGIAVYLGERFSEVTIDGAQAPDEDSDNTEDRDTKDSGDTKNTEDADNDSKNNANGRGDEDDTVSVIAGGAALLPVVARKTAAAGLTGFEWAVGVPGSIGGAVRMNAGGHGSDMAASLRLVGVFDLTAEPGSADEESAGAQAPVEWTVEQLALAYRQSAIGPSHVVTHAELVLARGDAEAAGEEISEIVRWRREHQPGGQNAGSVFANPDGDSAGRLIDQLGLKGFRVGTAEVSTKHANFIQADPDGSADDVYALIREVQLRVATATSIELTVENRLIGFGLEDDV